MTTAVIGALRVNLSADTAAFGAGLKGAQGKLAAFNKAAATGLAALTIAAAAAAAALAAGVAAAIRNADELGKTAQKIGIPVEKLSQLKFAAGLADVSMDTLSTGLGILSKKMSAAGDTTQTAYERLLTIADEFQRAPDGVNKTARAMEYFGRTGKEMIPFLNEGSAGIKRLMAEADALGLTVRGDTARAADEFGDNMERLGKIFEGIANQIAARLAPYLAELSGRLVAFLSDGTNAEAIADRLSAAVKRVADAVMTVITGWDVWRQFVQFDVTAPAASMERLSAAVERYNAARGAMKPLPELTFGDFTMGGDTPAPEDKPEVDPLASTKDLKDAQTALNTAVSEGKSIFESTRTPLEEYAIQLQKIAALQKSGAIDADTYARAQSQATAQIANQYLGLADGIAGALGTMFEDNKGIAYAQAIINTAQAITATLAQYGATPWGLAAAAVAAAAGAAQIAKIASTSSSSKSGAPSVGGGGGGTAREPMDRDRERRRRGGGGGGTVYSINIQGESISKDQIRELFANINKGLKDGHKIVLAA